MDFTRWGLERILPENAEAVQLLNDPEVIAMIELRIKHAEQKELMKFRDGLDTFTSLLESQIERKQGAKVFKDAVDAAFTAGLWIGATPLLAFVNRWLMLFGIAYIGGNAVSDYVKFRKTLSDRKNIQSFLEKLRFILKRTEEQIQQNRATKK